MREAIQRLASRHGPLESVLIRFLRLIDHQKAGGNTAVLSDTGPLQAALRWPKKTDLLAKGSRGVPDPAPLARRRAMNTDIRLTFRILPDSLGLADPWRAR